MEFYKKSKFTQKKDLSLFERERKKANNQLAWDLISKGVDVNEVFKNINFSIDNFLDIDNLEAANIQRDRFIETVETKKIEVKHV
jgi:DNA-binding protein